MTRPVYIIDDDVAHHRYLLEAFEHAGIEAKAFTSAEAFLDKYIGERAILILDHFMDEINGLELQRILKLKNSPVRIIFLTVSDDLKMAVQAMREGAFDFLVKPAHTSDIIAAVLEADKEPETIDCTPRQRRVANVRLGIRIVMLLWAMVMVSLGSFWYFDLTEYDELNLLAYTSVIGLLGLVQKFVKE